MSLKLNVITEFIQRFGEKPQYVVRAPGRVNLIGEHTDYNDGFVMPMAIDREMWLALRPREDKVVSVYSLDMKETSVVDVSALERGENHWREYVKGTAFALQERGYELQGWEGVMTGNVPIGSGLSSSAALELAIARAFFAVSGEPWNKVEMAKAARAAETEWMGVQIGIMDQLISSAGVEGHAVLIDCRSLELTPVPLPTGASVVILDTTTRRGLVDSAYNERFNQCKEAAVHFGVPALRDVTVAQFEADTTLDPLTRQRTCHVVTEDVRTLAASEAMRSGDAVTLGQLMNASHASLRDDYEVTNHELNVIVDIAQAQEGCYGARMTGAGFGGCAVALVEADKVDGFVEAVSAAYEKETSLTPNVYISQAVEGAGVVGI